MKRYLVIIEGRVQGVGMRSFCTIQAQKRGLTGSVKNLENGMVEVYVQGDEEKIDDFLAEIEKGNQFIRVDNISVKQVEIKEGESRFSYSYY